MDVDNAINEIIKGSIINFNSAKIIFSGIVEKLTKEFTGKPQDEIEQMALQILDTKIKRIKFSGKAVEFEGIVFGQTGYIDRANTKRYKELREKALAVWKENPQRAIAEELCDAEGRPLDTLQVFPSGKRNINYKKPIPNPGEQFVSKVFGLANRNGVIKPFSMFLSSKIPVPLFQPVRFFAILKSESDIYNLSQSSSTQFIIDNSLKIPSFPELVNTAMKDKLISLADIYDWHLKNSMNPGAYFITKGTVFEIDPTPNPFNKRVFWVDDREINSLPVKCWAPDFLEINFGPGSEIYIVGTTYMPPVPQGSEEKDLKENITINALGIYPINAVKPEETLPKEKIKETVISSISPPNIPETELPVELEMEEM